MKLLQSLARDCVADTSYAAIPVHPEFTYDAWLPIGGVFSDTLTTVFGIAAYTLEIWDPFAAADVKPKNTATFFSNPEPEVLLGLVRRFAGEPGTSPWTPLDHPNAGAVEVGGLELQRTVRNPPEDQLAGELDTVFRVVDRPVALPKVDCRVEVRSRGPESADLHIIVENTGYLGTAGLERAAQVGRVPGIRVTVDGPSGRVVEKNLGHLDGWGQTRSGSGAAADAQPARSGTSGTRDGTGAGARSMDGHLAQRTGRTRHGRGQPPVSAGGLIRRPATSATVKSHRRENAWPVVGTSPCFSGPLSTHPPSLTLGPEIRLGRRLRGHGIQLFAEYGIEDEHAVITIDPAGNASIAPVGEAPVRVAADRLADWRNHPPLRGPVVLVPGMWCTWARSTGVFRSALCGPDQSRAAPMPTPTEHPPLDGGADPSELPSHRSDPSGRPRAGLHEQPGTGQPRDRNERRCMAVPINPTTSAAHPRCPMAPRNQTTDSD